MKGKQIIALKTRLKRLGYKDSQIKVILSSSDELLEKLYLTNSDKALRESGNTIWSLYLTTKEELPHYLSDYQRKKNLYKEEEYKEGLELLNHLKGYKKRLVYQVLVNNEFIKRAQSIEYAHLIIKAHNELMATYVYNILINPYFNYLNVSKELATSLLEPTSNDALLNLKNNLDTEEKELLFTKALKLTQNSLKVFLNSEEKAIRENALEITNNLKEINLLITLEKAKKR